jgi:cytochrome c oxidase subunit I+III
MIALIMLGYVSARVIAGFVSARRIGEIRILQLWTDFTALTALMALGAAWGPGLLA